jgi:hypothetical protein
MMNQDKLKQMYAEGGLLKALLKDPAQREMARKMLTMEEGGMMKKYRMGGSMEYAEGGEMEPPKGTRSAGEFVRIQEPDLRDAYNSAWVQEYGPIEGGFKKLTPEQRERVLERASMMADRRFAEDLESADDEMAFKTRAYEEGRYSPGSSFMPREAQGNPADLQVMRAENMAIREREKLSPDLMRMFGM